MARKNYPLEKSSVCKNCGSENIENYCSRCGQIVQKNRFTFGAALRIFIDAFSLEKGFLHTFIMLLTKPGIVLNDSISGKTRPYANPLKYLIITVGIYTFIYIYSGLFEDSMNMGKDLYLNSNSTLNEINQHAQQDEAAIMFQNKIYDLLKDYFNFIPLLLIPFTSLATKWFYRKRKLLYGEFVIFNTYIFAQEYAIISILLLPIVLFLPEWQENATLLLGLVSLAYATYAIHKSLKGSIFVSLLKITAINIIGFLLFFFFIIFLFILFVIFMLVSGINLNQMMGI